MKRDICFYVAMNGDDKNPGTKEKPFATLARARDAVRELKNRVKGPITVLVRGGTYYLSEPLVFEPEDSGTPKQTITYAACLGEEPVISGGRRIIAEWKPYRDGIMMCSLAEVKEGKLDFTQLFVNGKRQIRARYSNYDPENPIEGGYVNAKGGLPKNTTHKESREEIGFTGQGPKGFLFDPKTFAARKWKRPDEAVIHIFPATYWGNLQWQIKDIDNERNIIWFGRGGFQLNTRVFAHACNLTEGSRFYIENVFEELDAPGEWYLDRKEGTLYYMPDSKTDLSKAEIVAPILKQVVEFRGCQERPIRNITLSGFRITHTSSTFLEPYEAPSLGDWTIHRGGAVFIEGAVDCNIEKCFFDAVGGNAVFINNQNRRVKIVSNKFKETGDSAICLVGSTHMALGSAEMFPVECTISNNLIHECGVFGKQIAGVFISTSKRITVSHNLIYDMPRAGICINDGRWGGHTIEYNEIQNTCRETADHGPFNAWGRDRYWCLYWAHPDHSLPHPAGNVFIDAEETVIIRYNYFREDSGWGIDLDDGASNYHIYNNLCVGCGIKSREGDYRTIENNIFINPANSPCFHVGNAHNHDRFVRNITVMSKIFDRPEIELYLEKVRPMHDLREDKGEIYIFIYPPTEGPWVKEIDYNLFYNDFGESSRFVSVRLWGGKKITYTLEEWRDLGFDKNSTFADPMFRDPKNGDYQVKEKSPALKLGFKNFIINSAGLLPDFPENWLDEREKLSMKYGRKMKA